MLPASENEGNLARYCAPSETIASPGRHRTRNSEDCDRKAASLAMAKRRRLQATTNGVEKPVVCALPDEDATLSPLLHSMIDAKQAISDLRASQSSEETRTCPTFAPRLQTCEQNPNARQTTDVRATGHHPPESFGASTILASTLGGDVLIRKELRRNCEQKVTCPHAPNPNCSNSTSYIRDFTQGTCHMRFGKRGVTEAVLGGLHILPRLDLRSREQSLRQLTSCAVLFLHLGTPCGTFSTAGTRQGGPPPPVRSENGGRRHYA